MTFDLLHCPICDSSSQGFTEITTDSAYAASRCNGCGLGIEHRLSADPLGQYPRQTYDKDRNAGDGGSRWRRFHHDTAVASLRMSQVGTSLPSLSTGGETWVDVGCSNGAFLALARRRGWNVRGVEADAATADEVSRVLGLTVMDFRTWSAAINSGNMLGSVRVVSFFDVIEHLFDPVGALQTASKSLMPGGAIIVEVPDLDDAGDNFTKWKHRRVSEAETEHVWHFSAKNLESLRVLRLPGFVNVHTARPFPGRLQVVWRKDVTPIQKVVANTQPRPIDIAVELAKRPPGDREAILVGMREEAPELFRDVTEAMQTLSHVADKPV